jgi:dTDP-4-dehydrorhamnose reductase
MIRLGRERPLVEVVDDEYVAPTYTSDLAVAIRDLIHAGGRGLFHITQSGTATWYRFARVIFDQLKLPARLEPIPATKFQSKVKRPAYSILDCAKFQKLTQTQMPDWRDALERHLQRLTATT